MAYIEPRSQGETPDQYRRRIYARLVTILSRETPAHPLRIQQNQPTANWDNIWRNLHEAPIDTAGKTAWYFAVHDIMPTNARLHRIRLADTTACAQCGREDTVLHRITGCGETAIIWNHTRTILGLILRTDNRHIPATWTIRPDFLHDPQQKREAILWMLAHHVAYTLRARRRLSLVDYMDFLRRARWKLYQTTKRPRITGNYLTMLDDIPTP
jgi:hypothetical protein